MAPTITTQLDETMVDQSPPSLTLSQVRSRSVSFSPLSVSSPVTPSTPHAAAAGASFPVRWSKELEQRLRHAQRNMEEHQKRWSEGQEEYWEEVEALQDLKRRFERFIRRRSKDHSREGKRFLRAASVGSSDVEMTSPLSPAVDPSLDNNNNDNDNNNSNNNRAAKKPSVSLLRRFSAVVSNSVHHEASLAYRPRRGTEGALTPRDANTASRSPSAAVPSTTGLDGTSGPGLDATRVRGRPTRVTCRSLTA